LKIDMHVHTNISSPCSLIDPGRMVERALEIGLDAVCVTEHDEIEGARTAQEIGVRKGLRVFRGVEVFTDFGDMLVYGLYQDAPSWITPFDNLLEMCGEAGAVIITAHPCRVADELTRLYGAEGAGYMLGRVDALETHNGGSSPEGNQAALELSLKCGLPGTGGSDAHHEFQLGRCLTVFEDEISSDEELVEALKSGRYRGAYPNEID